MPSARRRVVVLLAVVASGLLGLAVPAVAEPVPPTNGELIETDRIGSFDNEGAVQRLVCDGPTVVTGFRAWRVDNEVAEPITALSALCSPVTADEGLVELQPPIETAASGVPTSLDAVTRCPNGAVVTGLLGQEDDDGIFGLQAECGYLNADGSLTPAPDATPAFYDDGALPTAEVTCDPGAAVLGFSGNLGAPVSFRPGELVSVTFECAPLSFAGQPPVDTALNTTWPSATLISDGSPASNVIAAPGQARWYKFAVTPDSTVQVDLTQLAANYDLTLFKDIDAGFDFLTSSEDLALLGAEFAADAFSPSAFSPSAFSPSAFSPSAFSPSAFSPSAFSPSAFSPSAFSPSAFSPSAFSPSAFSPSAFSPSAFSPDVELATTFDNTSDAPRGLTEQQYADAFSSAQTRSLLAVSAREGNAPESIRSATWANSGFFYARVAGRNGASADQPFTISLTTTGGACGAPLDTFPDSPTFFGDPGTARTVLLTDSARLPGVDLAGLRAFAARAEIAGVVVDAADVPLLQDLNAQADALIGCSYAKNLVAGALRDIVNSYRDDSGTLLYVVLVGGDDVIPFYRYADSAGLGPESDYVPPVADSSGSQASLRSNLVLGQDAYGARRDVSVKGALVPLPELAVGRLIETPAEITATLDRYAALTDGVLPVPDSSLTTGYDFLADAADEVAAGLAAGIAGGDNDTLITDQGVPPTVTTVGDRPDRRHSWTADDLRAAAFGPQRHDVVYLAGHFSANSTLAADYDTTLLTTDLRDAPTDYENTLVLSPGCHSGYTILDRDVVPGVTVPLDWTQAFVQRGATLIAGTGYQYGDTDFVEYSERLYAEVITQLRYGTGAVPIGAALARAKQDYLATTVTLTGIHQKSLLEAALYGLPMLGLDLPTGRLTPPTPVDVVPTPVVDGPGAVLGLTTADVSTGAEATLGTRPRTDVDGNPTGVYTFATGPDGVLSNAGQPALPLASLDVTAPGQVLRGVGVRSGTYDDTAGIVPLTGAPATELNAVHAGFASPVFFPGRLATANLFDAVGSQGSGGRTRLNVTPAQLRSDGAATSVLRRYSDLDLQLFYSSDLDSYGGNVPALAAPPTLSDTRSDPAPGGLRISTRAVGDPAAGMQQVWVTYTGTTGPLFGRWASVDLVQDAADSTLWSAVLPLPAGQAVADVRFFVQAVNGVGLVGADDNQGRYFVGGTAPGLTPPGPVAPTALSLTAPAGGEYRTTASVTATWSGPAPLAGRPITFSVGSVNLPAVTDAAGVATATLPLLDRPGGYRIGASYDGDDLTAPSATSAAFTVARRPTALSLTPATVTVPGGVDTGLVATLSVGGLPLRDKPVYLTLTAAGQVADAVVGQTDLFGRVDLGPADVPSGTYTVLASFGASAVDLGSSVVDATDPDHLASSATATLTVTGGGTAPVAVPDAYSLVEGGVLTVAAPGVLGNDTGPAPLTVAVDTPPTSGALVLAADGGFSYTPGPDFVGIDTFAYVAVAGGLASTPTTVTITVTERTPAGCTITGTAGPDRLRGTAGRDVICGLGGDDVLEGVGGDDVLIGGSGDDRLSGGDGRDVLDGRSGADTLNGGAGNDDLRGGSGDDKLDGGIGNDGLDGGTDNDTLRGDVGADRLVGGPGADLLSGDVGNDTLDGVDGVTGNDAVLGGRGTDGCTSDPADRRSGCP